MVRSILTDVDIPNVSVYDYLFGDVDETLETAIPTDEWQGDASGAYTAQDEKQQARARAVAETDKKIEEIIVKQAKQVNNTRTTLGTLATALSYAVLPAMALRAFPPTIPEAVAFEVGAVAAAVPPSIIATEFLTLNSTSNAVEIASTAAQYTQIAQSSTLK